MQIALTKKLVDAVGIKNLVTQKNVDPIFSWTANWTKVWKNRRADDMIVLVNNATRFTVAIYQMKRKDLKKLESVIRTAIVNTLSSININPEIISEYMRMAGEIEFSQNKNRQAAAWVSKACTDCSYHVANQYNGIEKMFCDTIGTKINEFYVNYSSKNDEGFVPYKVMIDSLADLTGLPAYKYRAFELLVSLDLEIYKAERRIIVPAEIDFMKLHKVLQSVFRWEGYHLYDFTVIGTGRRGPVARLVPFEEDLEYDENAVLMQGRTLSEFFPEYKKMIYTYDMGDNWKHEIKLIRVIEEHDAESPYLLSASGQAPPEDVGGVWGFLEFREIMLDPDNPEYEATKEWARYWSPELNDLQKLPKVIYF